MKSLYYRLTSILSIQYTKEKLQSDLKISGLISDLHKSELRELFDSRAFRKGLPSKYRIEFHLVREGNILKLVFTKSPNERTEQRIRNSFRFGDYEKPHNVSNLAKK